MATKQENRRTDVIRCQYCGEDYSVTYKRCPFCDDKAGDGGYSGGDGTVSNKGGKRVATNTRGGGYGGRMQPIQIIGLLLSLVLIAAAIYIVCSVFGPLFGGDEASGSQSQPASSMIQSGASVSQPAVSASQPDVSVSAPDISGSGEVSTPVIPDPPAGTDVITPVVTATGITLKPTVVGGATGDVTLKANEAIRLVAEVTPAGCDTPVVWTSSNESVLAVSQDGTLTNVNTGNIQVTATVTAQVGDVKDSWTVRCKPGSTGKPATGNASSDAPAVKPGSTGVVTGTTTGLLIRSGPGQNYGRQDTATNGTVVTILEQTADGWFKINYAGDGGKTKTGYVSKNFIKVN